MSFLICLSPLDLSLYSGQNPYLSSHPHWYLKAPGEAHRAVAPQQSECHGHPHSQTVLEPAFLLLLCIFRRLVSPTDPAWELWSCGMWLKQFPLLLLPWLWLKDCRCSQSWDTSLSGTTFPLCFFSFTDPNEGPILSCPNPPSLLSLCPPLHSCHQGRLYKEQTRSKYLLLYLGLRHFISFPRPPLLRNVSSWKIKDSQF